jgi:hypothetical protein
MSKMEFGMEKGSSPKKWIDFVRTVASTAERGSFMEDNGERS